MGALRTIKEEQAQQAIRSYGLTPTPAGSGGPAPGALGSVPHCFYLCLLSTSATMMRGCARRGSPLRLDAFEAGPREPLEFTFPSAVSESRLPRVSGSQARVGCLAMMGSTPPCPRTVPHPTWAQEGSPGKCPTPETRQLLLFPPLSKTYPFTQGSMKMNPEELHLGELSAVTATWALSQNPDFSLRCHESPAHQQT